jgi:penicillin-insensitive murein endopeptidase
MRGVIALVLLVAGTAHAEKSQWAAARAPSGGSSKAIGGYSAGCLSGGVELALEGRGWKVMRPARKRHFAHRDMIEFVHALAAAARAARLGAIALGDLSQPRGGPAPSGHSSHQTGLDIDIWYAIGKAGKRPKPAPMVDRDKNEPLARWGSKQVELLRLAARDPRVERIFVHPALKKALCEREKRDRGWLRTIRPWWGHDEHFHVRLKCPEGNDDCRAQDPIAGGDGCAELDGWLSPEAAAERAVKQKTYQSRVGAMPELPTGCSELVR